MHRLQPVSPRVPTHPRCCSPPPRQPISVCCHRVPPERSRRALAMVRQMDAESFGGCTNYGECQEACPKEISVETIALLNRDFLRAAHRAAGVAGGGCHLNRVMRPDGRACLECRRAPRAGARRSRFRRALPSDGTGHPGPSSAPTPSLVAMDSPRRAWCNRCLGVRPGAFDSQVRLYAQPQRRRVDARVGRAGARELGRGIHRPQAPAHVSPRAGAGGAGRRDGLGSRRRGGQGDSCRSGPTIRCRVRPSVSGQPSLGPDPGTGDRDGAGALSLDHRRRRALQRRRARDA